jgi:hypothetical protein
VSWKILSNGACYRHCRWSNRYEERQGKRKVMKVLLLRSGYLSWFNISLTLHFIHKERRTFINRFSAQLIQQFVTIRPPSNTFHRTKQLAFNTSAMKLLVVSNVAGCATVSSLSLNAYEGSISRLKRPGSEVNQLLLSIAEMKNWWSYTSTPHIRLDDLDRGMFVESQSVHI